MEIKIDTKVLDKIKADLTNLTETSFQGVCNGFTSTLDGKQTRGHTACHSWISNVFYPMTETPPGSYSYSYKWDAPLKKDAKDFLVASCHSPENSNASKEATGAAILWLASDDSPFGQWVVNRDDPEHLKNSGLIVLCGPNGASHVQVMWMCKFLRYATEGAKSLDTWHTLYKAGVNPILAALVATYIGDKSASKFISAPVYAHCEVFGASGMRNTEPNLKNVMDFTFNPDAADTFSLFSGKPEKIGKKGAAEAGPFKFDKSKITDMTKTMVADDGWGGKITSNGVSADDLVKNVLAWQEELGGWIPGARFQSRTEFQAEFAMDAQEVLPLPTATTVYLDLDL